ncbi:MAG: flagellar hook assembly protein FlgD [Gemmatimonas sp.]
MITSVRTNTFDPMFAKTATNPPKNYDPVVGPAEPTGERSGTPLSDSMGKDDFMQLLVAQLKNQDPMNPMDGKDMAAQLAQFSSVEQMMQLNTTVKAQAAEQTKMAEAIADLTEAQQAQGDTLASLIEGQMAVSTVGKTGVTTGNTLYVDRDGSGSITIDTGTVSGAGTVEVKDAAGNVVATGTLASVKAGMQTIDLRDTAMTPPLRGGNYTYSVRVGATGTAPADVKTYTTGRITGLRYEQGAPVLVLGDSLSVPFAQLIQVRN